MCKDLRRANAGTDRGRSNLRGMTLAEAEGIPANSRDVNRSTRRKNSGREQNPEAMAGAVIFLMKIPP